VFFERSAGPACRVAAPTFHFGYWDRLGRKDRFVIPDVIARARPRVEIGGDSTAADVNTELARDGDRVIAQGRAPRRGEWVVRECSGSAKRGMRMPRENRKLVIPPA